MNKVILLTGATDGIGLETAKVLASQGHDLLIHGRNAEKLAGTKAELEKLNASVKVECFRADLSDLASMDTLANEIKSRFSRIDVLINNAGVYRTANPIGQDGRDIRFTVNTIAPYRLTMQLLPLMDNSARVVNLSSAAQASVDLDALRGDKPLTDGEAYAQSKLAITMWSRSLAEKLQGKGPLVVAVNPASFLGSKMVKEAYGVAGGDLQIGADILIRAAFSEEFTDANGKYFDNDSGQFSRAHSDCYDSSKLTELIRVLDLLD